MTKGKLAILDLNGLLVFRGYCADVDGDPRVRVEHMTRAEPNIFGNFYVWKRPGVDKFIADVFREFEHVAIWSSACSTNVQRMRELLFGDRPLEFVWDQTNCERIERPGERKPLFRKNLPHFLLDTYEHVLMLDDSALKMTGNPEANYLIVEPWSPLAHERTTLAQIFREMKKKIPTKKKDQQKYPKIVRWMGYAIVGLAAIFFAIAMYDAYVGKQ